LRLFSPFTGNVRKYGNVGRVFIKFSLNSYQKGKSFEKLLRFTLKDIYFLVFLLLIDSARNKTIKTRWFNIFR
jgi:hypothetical protein